MAVSRGRVQVTQGALQVSPAAGDDAVVVVLRADLRSSDFAGIEWNVAGLPGDADVRLIWRTSYQPERLNLATMTVDDGRLRPIVMSGDPAWIGTIAGLGLAVRGTLQAPIEIRGVTAKPLGAFELAAKPRRRSGSPSRAGARPASRRSRAARTRRTCRCRSCSRWRRCSSWLRMR